MENAKVKEYNSTEKSEEEYLTLKFEPTSVETGEEEQALSKPVTSVL